MVKRLLVLIVYAPLALIGLRWGLPTAERVALWLGDPLPDELPDHAYVALHSMHPDEHKILEPLANMDPARLDFNPRHFDHPTLHIYLVGAALGLARVAGLIEVAESQQFYLHNPEEMGRVYLIGRLLTVLFGAGLLLIVAALAGRIVGPSGTWVAPLCVVASAPFVVHCHYLTTDLPLTFWIALSALASTSRSRKRAVWWSAAIAGLAAGTKYYGMIALVFPLYRVMSRRSSFVRPARTAAATALLALGVFALTSPYVVLAPRDFKTTGYDVWHEVFRRNGDPQEIYLYTKKTGPGWLQYAGHVIPESVGLPLALASVAGLVLAVARRAPHRGVLLLGTVPYFLLIGSMPFHLVKHSLPLLPFLGVGAAALLFQVRGVLRFVLSVALGLCVGFGLAHSVNHVWVLRTEDSRVAAGTWLEENVPESVPVARPWDASALGVPLDESKRQVISFCPIMQGLRLERLNIRPQPVFAMTEFEYRQYLRLRGLYTAEAAFFDGLLRGTPPGPWPRYRILSFSPRGLLPFPLLRPSFPPHDWIFYSPRVVVAIPCGERAALPAPSGNAVRQAAPGA
jgi:hypothetical protein